MKRETIRLWDQADYQYSASWGFLPRLDGYLHDDGQLLPAIIIVPGGGYRRCSPREGECVALRFYEMGYQTFVCTYTTNPLGDHPLGNQPAKDIAQAVRYVRENAGILNVLPNRITLCGFSAGGHAAATVGVHWPDFAQPDDESASVCRPDALILCYPVVSVFSALSHSASGIHLLGEHPAAESIHYMQLEKNVRSDCPPVFLWHTLTDQTVSPDNSRTFANAFQSAGVPCELHLFSTGEHGLSLADGSIVISEDNLFTLEQTAALLNAMERGDLVVEPQAAEQIYSHPEVKLLQSHGGSHRRFPANEEVSNWVTLADQWLCRLQDDPKQ